MKLHKINKEGTIAVVIPKDIASVLGWEEGQDVIVNMTDNDCKLFLLNMTKTKMKEKNR